MAKKFKIYNTSYPLSPSAQEAPSGYGFRNDIVDEVPKSKFVGYVTLEDGSVIQCFKKFNPIPFIAALVVALACASGAYYYFILYQPKDVVVNGTPIKEGSDSNVVSYNGFMSAQDGIVDICFTNGSIPANVTVQGDGITCDTINVNPGETVDVLPITYTTDKSVVNAKIIITTATSSYEQPVVIEIPENNTSSSVDSGLDNYWKGETVYGIDSSGNATTNTFDDVQETE